MRISIANVALVAALLTAGVARAAESDIRVMPPSEDVEADEPAAPEPSFAGYRLESSKFGIGLDGYAGIAGEATSGEGRAHGLVGALVRARLHYFQIGGTIEVTDSGRSQSLGESRIEHWRSIGGFAGAFFPFEHWIDFDAAVGLASRTYLNDDAIYGPGGFSKGLTELTLRFGVSDRMSSRFVAPRLGAALALGFDFGRQDAIWQREYLTANGDTAHTTGSTTLGGVSIGIVVSAGFEVGGRPGWKGL